MYSDRLLIEQAYLQVLGEMSFGTAISPEGQQRVTREGLIKAILASEQRRSGATFIGVTQVTKYTTNVAPTPRFVLPGLIGGKTNFAKCSQVSGIINNDYAGQMNREMEKRGLTPDFVAQPSGYDKYPGSAGALWTKQDPKTGETNIYIYYRPLRTAKSFSPKVIKAIHEIGPNPTAADFAIASNEEVEPFKRPVYPNKFDVKVNKVALGGIVGISIGGAEYFITDIDPIRKAIYEVSGAPQPPQEPADFEQQVSTMQQEPDEPLPY